MSLLEKGVLKIFGGFGFRGPEGAGARGGGGGSPGGEGGRGPLLQCSVLYYSVSESLC